MSYQLTFWRYQDETQPHDDYAFYEKLIYDDIDGILGDIAPIDKPIIKQSLADKLSSLGFEAGEVDRYLFSNEKGQAVEVFLTPYFLLFECKILSLQQVNDLMELGFSYGLKVFDPQANERFGELEKN